MGKSRVERGQNAMNVVESDLLYTARSGSEFTDPGSGSGLVWPVQAAPETRECCRRNDNNNRDFYTNNRGHK